MKSTPDDSPAGSTVAESVAATHSVKPPLPGSFLATAAAVGAVFAVSDSAIQHYALFVVVFGLAVMAAGEAIRQRRRWTGTAIAAAGALVIAYGLLFAAGRIDLIIHRLVSLPSLLGLAVLGIGLLPIRRGWERALVAVGTGLLSVGVVTSGVVESASTLSLLAGGAATIVAWDTAEQAISLGRQVGRRAGTYRATLTHFSGTVLASVAFILVAQAVFGLDVGELSLVVLVSLLVAGFVLVVALRH